MLLTFGRGIFLVVVGGVCVGGGQIYVSLRTFVTAARKSGGLMCPLIILEDCKE